MPMASEKATSPSAIIAWTIRRRAKIGRFSGRCVFGSYMATSSEISRHSLQNGKRREACRFCTHDAGSHAIHPETVAFGELTFVLGEAAFRADEQRDWPQRRVCCHLRQRFRATSRK